MLSQTACSSSLDIPNYEDLEQEQIYPPSQSYALTHNQVAYPKIQQTSY